MADRVHPKAAGKANADNINPTADAPPFPATKSQLYGASRPSYRPQPRRRRLCCSICIWLTAIIAVIVLLLAVASTAVYLIYRPHRPSFSVTSLKIDSSKSTPDFIFDLDLAATNPNKKVEFNYRAISVAISSNGIDLGLGSFPEFVQGKRNTTAVKVTAASGGGGEIEFLKAAKKSKSEFPLEIEMETKVKVRMGWLKTPKVGLRVFCDGITAGFAAAKKKKTAAVAVAAAAAVVENAECKVNFRVKIWKWFI